MDTARRPLPVHSCHEIPWCYANQASGIFDVNRHGVHCFAHNVIIKITASHEMQTGEFGDGAPNHRTCTSLIFHKPIRTPTLLIINNSAAYDMMTY